MGYSLWSLKAIKQWCSHAMSLSQASTFARVLHTYSQTAGEGIDCWVSWFVRVVRANLSQCRFPMLLRNTAESGNRVSDEDGSWRRSTYVDPGEVAAATPSSASTNIALARWQQRRANVGKFGPAGRQRADAVLEEASAIKDRVLESILVQNPQLLHARHIAQELRSAAGEGYHAVKELVHVTSTLTAQVKDIATRGRRVVSPSRLR